MIGQTKYSALIQQTAAAYGLDPDLLEAQVVLESSGKPDAFRWEPAFYETYIAQNTEAKAGAFGPYAACSQGLLQIMLETAMERGFADRPEQLFVDRIGLAWGAKQLQHLLTLTPSDYPLALARYNGGPGVRRAAPPAPAFPPGPLAYVQRIYQIAGKAIPEAATT